MQAIYATIARAIRKPNPHLKTVLLAAIQNELLAFDASCRTHLVNQAAFNAWHSIATGHIATLPFTWTDACGAAHPTLSFGAAQKFLNLGLKDWWAISANGTHPATPVDRLHGPLDQIVYSCTSRFCGPVRSLTGPNGMTRSYVNNLVPADYLAYQDHLEVVAHRLSTGLHLPAVPSRVEVEQLLWGWV
jgi:hypothetical protein